MNKFKVGDRIRCVLIDYDIMVDGEYTITRVHPKYPDMFEIDYIPYWYASNHFELAKRQPKNKPGEYR